MADDAHLDRLAALLRDARQIVVLTGAGISTESGIPDFRGPQGLWTKDPSAERRRPSSTMCTTPSTARCVAPAAGGERFGATNAGHVVGRARTPGDPARSSPERRRLHQAAGTSPEIVIEIHGTVHKAKCLSCGWRGPMEETLARVRAGDDDPACLECGGMLKSATISFGENLVPADLQRAQRAAAGADVFLAVGTSLGVYPAAALPELALRAGGVLAVLNAEETPFDPLAEFVFRDRLGEVLQELVQRVAGS
jgi:NAD-dependent deacetylase